MIKLGATQSKISSHKCGQNNSCVEVASPVADTVLIKDTKRPAGPALRVSPEAFTALLGAVK